MTRAGRGRKIEICIHSISLILIFQFSHMGSFNTSCFASRQTIAPGDPCVVVPVVQQRTFHAVELTYRGQNFQQYGPTFSACHPSRFWTPVGAFFEAVYDDYGGVRLLDTPSNRVRLHIFLQDALAYTASVSEGQNTTHDPAFDLAAFLKDQAPLVQAELQHEASEARAATWPQELFEQSLSGWAAMWDVAQEYRMFWADYFQVPRPMNFAILHKAAFEALVAHTEDSRNWRGESLAMESQIRAMLPALEALKDTCSQRARRMFAGRSATDEQLQDLLQSLHAEELRKLLQRFGDMQGMRYPGEVVFLEQASRAVFSRDTVDVQQWLACLRPVLEVRYACMALENLNLHFEPMVYAGQDYDNSIGQRYAQFVDKVADNVTTLRNLDD